MSQACGHRIRIRSLEEPASVYRKRGRALLHTAPIAAVSNFHKRDIVHVTQYFDAFLVFLGSEVCPLREEGKPQGRGIFFPRCNPFVHIESHSWLPAHVHIGVSRIVVLPVSDSVLVLLPVTGQEQKLQIVHTIAKPWQVCYLLWMNVRA